MRGTLPLLCATPWHLPPGGSKSTPKINNFLASILGGFWWQNGAQMATKIPQKCFQKSALKWDRFQRGPGGVFSPYFGALAPIKMSEFCGRGVKNHMFAHFTAFSRKVPIFTPKFDIFWLQKVSKMLPKTPKNIVPIWGCFFDAFWCQNDPQKSPQIPQNIDKTAFGAPIFSPTQHKVIPKSIWAPKWSQNASNMKPKSPKITQNHQMWWERFT